jgi:hypothetical protein
LPSAAAGNRGRPMSRRADKVRSIDMNQSTEMHTLSS